jgi:hypothetical protein
MLPSDWAHRARYSGDHPEPCSTKAPEVADEPSPEEQECSVLMQQLRDDSRADTNQGRRAKTLLLKIPRHGGSDPCAQCRFLHQSHWALRGTPASKIKDRQYHSLLHWISVKEQRKSWSNTSSW